MADTAITPTTGSLGFTGEEVYFINSGDSKMFFTGYAPTLLYLSPIITPGTGSLTLTTQLVERRTGIDFVGYAPTIRYDRYQLPATGSASFTGQTPSAVQSSPPNKTIQPETGSIGFTGYAAGLLVQTTVLATDSLVFTGYAPNANIAAVTTPVYPFFDQLEFTGYAPTLTYQHFGTPIYNATATTDVPTNYQIDDRTGFKIKVKDPMVKDYTGHYMRPESADIRSEQEFIRSKPERHRGPLRPEPVGNERHIDEEYPNGVDPDTDL